MLNLTDYQITEEIYTNPKRIVYRGIRLKDQQPVILKCFGTTYPTPIEIARLQHEYEITKNLNLSGIIKPITLLTEARNPILIFEDMGGISLKQYLNDRSLELGEYLKIAIQLAQTLGELHQCRIVHKDIKPSNIIFNPDTFKVKLTDFAIASQLTTETPTISHPNLLEGSLAYMSPEQTGRMNRVIDYRTDFYSLGVTLYEMLTGQLPYDSDDAMELVHCHIARISVPPKQVNPQIPPVISDLIMKLLAKTAEDRYQSGFGLKIDLEKCLNQWQKKGNILEFTLATQDFSGQLQIPQKLYGRERELAQLLVAFERVCSGTTEMMLVAGYSGIGKSALVQEIHKPLVQYRGYFISGKFDQYKRNIPYSSLIQAFSELMRQLLTESEQQIQIWKEKLLRVLGSNGQVIIDVIPEVELIIGQQPPIPELGATENQNRFNLFLKKFIHVFTQKEHPLVLFLDDLQWADLASLKLIQLLMTESESKYLLLIGAYRDNEVAATHPLMMTLDNLQKSGALVNQITLQPLEMDCVNQLIAETLNYSHPRLLEKVGDLNYPKSQPLAELVLNKTNGNPFFLTQLLKSLHQEGLLSFNFSKRIWHWDIELLQAVGITDNVVDLMISQIQKLSQETQNILKLAACIGNQFNLEMLSIVYEKSISDTTNQLWEAIQAGLIILESNRGTIPVGENEPGESCYKFLHDRVQQAAYALIEESSKKTVHLQIGRLLWQNTSPEKQAEEIFEIVDHLNQGIELINDEFERIEIAKLNLIAGQKAKAAAAYQSAMKYFNFAVNLLTNSCWQSHYELTLIIYQEATETAFFIGEFEQMETWTRVVMQQAQIILDRVRVYEIKIRSCEVRRKLVEAVKLGLEVLEMLGTKLPESPTPINIQQALAETTENLAGKNVEELIHLPLMSDRHALAVLRLITNLVPSVFLAAPALFPIMVCQQINLSIKYGKDRFSASGFADYGIVLSGVLQEIERGYKFGQLALNIVEQLKALDVKTQTLFKVSAFIVHWKHHVRETLPLLEDAYYSGLENGDLAHTGYSASHKCQYSYWSGLELKSLEHEMASYSKAIAEINQETALKWLQPFHQVVLNLIGHSPDPCHLIGEAYNEDLWLSLHIQANERTVLHYIYLNKLVLCYLFYEYEKAVEHGAKAQQYLDGVTGWLAVPLFYFYDSLAQLAVYPLVSVSEQETRLATVKENQEKMAKWAHHAPMNFLHKFYLMEAEKYRVLDHKLEAIELYDKAIALAQKNEYINEEALAYELAAKFYLSWGKETIAQVYLEKAYYSYQVWGAIAKVKHLEAKYPKFLARTSVNKGTQTTLRQTTITTPTTSSNLGETLDLATVMKASQAISEEIVLSKLLERLMKIAIENAAAQSGVLLLNREGQLFVEADGTIESDQILVRQSIPMEGSDRIPLSIINYVTRTQENIVLNDAIEQGNFINDPYIIANQTKSVLCTPILSQGKLIGILYLENNLIAGTFTSERTQLLKLLCSQAAISLENAQLYEAQKEYTKTLEQQVQERTQELQQQKALFDGFFTASKAGFIIYDKELRYVQVNEAIAKVNGMPAADHIGKTLREVVPHIAPIVEPTFQQILATGEPVLNVEVSGETASQPGVELHWLVSYFPLPGLDGKPIGVGTVLVEITDRKRAEEALRHSEERWQLALNGANDGIWDWNIKTNEVFISPRYKQMLGYEDHEMENNYEAWSTRLHPDERDLIIQELKDHLEGKTSFYTNEHRLRCKDGAYKWMLARGRALWDEDGKAIRVSGSVADITERKQAEQALQENEAFLRSIYDGVDQAIFVVDVSLDGEFRFAGWNRVGETFVGVSSQNAIGKTPEATFGAVVGANLRQHYTDCLMAGTAITYEEHFVSNGEQNWSLTTLNPLRDAAGNIHRIIGTGTNISDRKRAEAALQESERVFRAIFNGAMDAMTITDDTAQYVDANPAACQLFGLSKEELLKAKISDFNEPGIDFAPIWLYFLEQGQFVGEYRLHRFDGTVRDVEFSASANFIPHRHLSVLRDVSDRKEAEAALQQAKEAADAASRAKGEFLSKMSHELRTPLNAILGFSQLLNRDSTLTSQQQEYLGIINRAGEHLLTLINDVLEMSKIEAGRIELRENTFNLLYLLNSLKEMFQLRAESKGLKLNFHQAPNLPQYIQTDESKLRQVLINLLSNAIKFTETGNVILRVRTTEKVNNKPTKLPTSQSSNQLQISSLLFEIQDTGPGIAAEEIETLFEAFVQTETGRKAESGTGLGLPISRHFVHLMGGEITVSSLLHQGTIFQFDIQVKLPENLAVETPKEIKKIIGLAPNQSPYRILVVEDQSDSRLLLVKLLSQVGFEVKEATNGQIAVSLTEEWQPNLIWMDMQMPVMNGYEATKQIRTRESLLSTTPSIIIALTANAFAEDKAAVLSAGCHDFVSKPFREEVIFEKIATYLGVRYLYEQSTLPKVEISAEKSLEPELFQGVSPEWMTQLYQAALELDDERVRQLQEQINHSHPLLATSLESCTKKLRFDTILEVIKKMKNT